MDPLIKLAGLGECADEAGKRHLFVAKSFKKAEDFKKKNITNLAIRKFNECFMGGSLNKKNTNT